MNIKTYKILLILILFMLLICSILHFSNKPMAEIMVNHKTIVDENIIDITCSDSCFYVLSRYDEKIKCYDFEGNKLFEFGERGRKPGQFLIKPQAITIHNNFLILADSQAFEIEIFSLNGQYLRTLNCSDMKMHFAFNSLSNGNKLFMEGLCGAFESIKEVQHKIFEFDNKFHFKEIFSESYPTKYPSKGYSQVINPFLEKQNSFQLEENQIVFWENDKIHIENSEILLKAIPETSVNKKIIEYYDNRPEWKNLKDLGIKFELNLPEKLPKIKNVFSVFGKTYVLSYQQYISNQINRNQNEIYCYNPEKKKLEKVKFPIEFPVSEIIYVDGNRIFLSSNSELVILHASNKS